MVVSSGVAAGGYDHAFAQSRTAMAPSPQTSPSVDAPAAAQSSVPAAFHNPYPHVPDRVYFAFEQAAQGGDAWVADAMRNRLFEQSMRESALEGDWIERARLLRESALQAKNRENIQEAIRVQNLQLAGRGQPAMQPAEERALAMRLESMGRSQAAFVDRFEAALQTESLEAVA